MTYQDIIIAGAGPAGLCLARALSGLGLSITLIEKSDEAILADPPFDGREIALTQHSAQLLRDYGLWQRIVARDPAAIAPLVDAKVMDGGSPFGMVIGHQDARGASELGWLVGNHHIRRAAYESVLDAIARHRDIRLLAGRTVEDVVRVPGAIRVHLDSDQCLEAKLLIAADSRFSATRKAAGIAADAHDFGRAMLVCTMTHDLPHANVAWEWFGYGQTLALLPMNDDPATGAHRASAVLTLPPGEMDAVMALDDAAFGAEMTRRFAGRLGAMRLASTRHAYPLVGVYPRRTVGERFACIGDAAVGMHPVTAHGFNFGLLGVERLAKGIALVQRRGGDVGDPAMLADYERGHRLATKPLYRITQAIVGLYTDERPLAKLARGAALRIGNRLPPFRRAVAASLTGSGGRFS